MARENMELFDTIISDTLKQLHPRITQRWDYNPAEAWPDACKSELILQRDMAFELGGSAKPGFQYCCVTTGDCLDSRSETLLCGPDIGAITADSAFARITLVRVSGLTGPQEDHYRQLCDAAFVKYRVFPDGYMMRISPESNREQVRLSKQAITRGISFRGVGADFIRAHETLPNIVSVKVIFVTDPAADYAALEQAASGVQERMKALNTIFSGIPTDCASCQMKPLCDEVEGMRELHTRRAVTA